MSLLRFCIVILGGELHRVEYSSIEGLFRILRFFETGQVCIASPASVFCPVPPMAKITIPRLLCSVATVVQLEGANVENRCWVETAREYEGGSKYFPNSS